MSDSENTKMERFQIYLCRDDADLVRWLAKHFAPESESNIIKRCILTSTSLTEMSREVFYRQNARRNCPVPEKSE